MDTTYITTYITTYSQYIDTTYSQYNDTTYITTYIRDLSEDSQYMDMGWLRLVGSLKLQVSFAE